MSETRKLIRVACCQVQPRLGEVDRNRAMLRGAIVAAATAGAQLIVLPELCTTGYTFESPAEARALAQRATGGVLDDWAEEAARAEAVIIGGFAESDESGGLYNSAGVVDPSGVLTVYRKTHLWEFERQVFQAGAVPPPVLDTPVGRIGVGVCYDLFFPEFARGLAMAGAEIAVFPTNAPASATNVEPRESIGVSITRATAHVNRMFVAVCDRYGEERGQRWVGRTTIADPDGDLLVEAPGDREQTLLADCDLATAQDKTWTGTTNDALADRRPDIYDSDEAV
jgi:predicted amidohydrolase